MSSVARGARRLATAAAGRSGKAFTSCLLVSLNDGGQVVKRHPMDTNIDEYYRVVNEIVIPNCMEIAPEFEGYSDRVKQLIDYENPAFSDVWNFVPELTYRMVAPPEQQTGENLTRIRILRAVLDLSWTMTAVLDDIVDGADTRRHKPAWHTICEGGVPAALYDGTLLSFLPIHVLQKEFRGAPGYNMMLGMLLQDDFNDYYSSSEATGKPCCDIMNGGTTWASVTACKHFTPAQKKLFKESYGSADPEKVNTVKQLYDEVDLAGLYLDDMRHHYRELAGVVEQVPHPKVREALTSHLDWLIGDLKE